MSLRIACDLDGTLADMDAALQREARRLFGPEVDLHAVADARLESAEDIEGQLAARPRSTGLRPPGSTGSDSASPPLKPSADTARPLTRAELRRLWAHIGQVDNFWMSLGEIEPGAVSRLATLASRHRWEVIFLTQRPPSAGDTTQTQSHRWLQTHGFDLPSVFVMSGSRGKVADALTLDAVIDDRPENCLDVATDSSATPLLIWRMGPDAIPPGIKRTRVEAVYSMAEALARLEQLTEERARPRTLTERLRGAIGI
jgi:hypothetical protein